MTTYSSGASGVPISLKRPGMYLQVLFGASPSGAGGGPKKLLLLGNKTSSGSMTADTEIKRVLVDDEAVTYAGEGSELHLMVKAARVEYPFVELYILAVTEASGSKAAVTFTVTNAATGTGQLLLFIHGIRIPVAIVSGDAAATQATNIDKAIKAASRDLCVTSSVSGAVVTVTYRHNGTRGNDVRVKHEADPSITGSTYAWSGTALSGGTGDDVLTTAITTASTARYHFICHAHVTSTQIGALKTHLNTVAGPTVGKRQQSIACVAVSFGSATTLAQAANAERMQILWLRSSSTLSCVVAAAWAAKRVKEESVWCNVNLSSFNPTAVDLGNTVAAPYAEADFITDTECNASLDVGLTPVQIGVTASKRPYIPLSITTHSQDSNANPDSRTLTTNNVSVPDEFADILEAWVPAAFPNKVVMRDILSGDDPLPANATTPNIIKISWYTEAKARFSTPQNTALYDIDADYATWSFNLASGNANRVNSTMQVTPAPWFTQFSGQIRQGTAQA